MMNSSFMSNSSSSSTSSDEDIQQRRAAAGGNKKKKKRKWKDYFESLMRDIVHKQEDMQKKFLEALERRDRDRAAKEESWRNQEIARMNREREILAQDRQIAAANDESVFSLLQKVADQHNLQLPINFPAAAAATPLVAVQAQPTPPPLQQQQQTTFRQPPPSFATTTTTTTPTARTSETSKINNGGGGGVQSYYSAQLSGGSSSSRWPKAEVQALINLRTSLDLKYLDNGPKGPLWEEISSEMGKLGYSRNSKRCKEKWENINKYYKKVKESSKKRRPTDDDSKTCPYFHQLEAIYEARTEAIITPATTTSLGPAGYGLKPENPLLPIMAQPQHQQNENIEDDEDDGEEDDDDGSGGAGAGGDDDRGVGYVMISVISEQTAGPNSCG